MTNTSAVLWWTAAISAVAILAAPLVALWVQRKSEKERASEERRQAIFRTLWINRRRHFWVARIDALNMIDVEFHGERKVRDAWQDLFAHYRDEHPGLNDAQIGTERDDKFATLLFEISQVLGYEFGKAFIRDNVYRPDLHQKVDEIELETRRLVLELLKGDALPVRFVEKAGAAAS